jgi:threonylcarbamoyladenosine tRNA methylthiotransferase CDKAL1
LYDSEFDDLLAIAMAKKKVYIDSIGCVENALEGQRIAEFFSQNNWRVTKEPKQADLLLVNTCGVIGSKERQSVHKIQELEKIKQPSARIIICGCLPDINLEVLKETISNHSKPDDEHIVTPATISRFNQIVEADIPIETVVSNQVASRYMRHRLHFVHIGRRIIDVFQHLKLPLPPHIKRVFYCFEEPDWHYIKICSGCLLNCSFCAIKFAKGKLVSKSPDEIILELRAGLVKGQKSIVLAGDDTGAYGRDINADLVELLSMMVAESGDFHIYIRNLEPIWFIRMFERLKPLFQTGKIRGITIPVQSGSNRILKAMKRGYTIEEFCQCVSVLNREVENLFVITHVMVGFPGETSADFRKTLQLVSKLRFDGVAPEQYYPRPRIPALELPNPIPTWKRRWRLMRTYIQVYWVVYLNKLNWIKIRKLIEIR